MRQRQFDRWSPLIVLVFLLMMLAALALFSGCQTVAGLGRDLQRVGEWTQEKLDHGFSPD